MQQFPILLALLLTPILAWAETPKGYPADKMVKKKAVMQCQNLASVTLNQREYRAIATEIEATVVAKRSDDPNGFFIIVAYPYRKDGVYYACTFKDFRSDGLIQLREFGTYNSEGPVNHTVVDLLY